MKLSTRQTCYGIEIKVDEISTDIYKKSGESEDFIKNLLKAFEEVCRMDDLNIIENLENHFDIKIVRED